VFHPPDQGQDLLITTESTHFAMASKFDPCTDVDNVLIFQRDETLGARGIRLDRDLTGLRPSPAGGAPAAWRHATLGEYVLGCMPLQAMENLGGTMRVAHHAYADRRARVKLAARP